MNNKKKYRVYKPQVMQQGGQSGYHMMPDGSWMSDMEMQYRQGGAPCYNCGGNTKQFGGDADFKKILLEQRAQDSASYNPRWDAMKTFGSTFNNYDAIDAAKRYGYITSSDDFNRKYEELHKDPRSLGMVDGEQAAYKAYQQGKHKPLSLTNEDVIKLSKLYMDNGAAWETSSPMYGTKTYNFDNLSPQDFNRVKRMADWYKSRKQFGGTSEAPQNSTIDGIGKTRTDLMKNYLSSNLYNSFLKEEEKRLQDEMQQFFQDGGSVYDPNLSNQYGYANAISATKKKHSKDRADIWNTFQNIAANYPQQTQPMQQQVGQPIQQRTDFLTPNSNGVPNQGFGSNQPDMFGRNLDRSFGQNQGNQFMQTGGAYLPMAQLGIPKKGLNFDVIPTTNQMDPALIKKYKAENPTIPMFGEMEGSNDPSTGYWDIVRNDWSKDWGVGGWEESEMYEDPRMTQALKKLVPGMGAEGVMDYASNLWTMPQKAVNKWLTGYYESPSTTYERYNEPLSDGARFMMDVVTDPMMYPEIPYMLGKGAYKAGAKGVAKAAPYIKKGAEKVVEQTTKVYNATKDLIAKYFPADFLQQHGALILSRAMQAGVHAESDPERQKAMLDNLVKQELSKVNPQQSTQVQAPTIRPIAAQQNPYANMSAEDIKRMFPSTPQKKYGGDLPMAQVGLPPASIMRNDLYNQGQALANSYRSAENPYGIGNVIKPTIPQSYMPPVDYNGNELVGIPYRNNPNIALPYGAANTTDISSSANAGRTGQTPDERRAAAAAAAAKAKADMAKSSSTQTTTNTASPAKTRGNVTKDDVITNTNANTNTGVNNANNQAYYPGYGGGRFKIKGKNLVDPRTGMTVRKIKYDTAQSPRDYYGGRGPRVVKYNIYNNGVYPQGQGSNQMSNAYMNENYNYPSSDIPYVQPLGIQGSDNRQLQVPVGGYSGVSMPAYQQPNGMYMNDGQLVPGNFDSYELPSQDQVPAGYGLNDNVPDPYYNPEFKKETRQINKRDRQNTRYENRQYKYDDRINQDLIEQGLFQSGGPFNMTNDLNNVPSNFDPSYTLGNNTGDSAYVNNQGQVVAQNQQPDIKAKWKGNNDGFNQWSPMMIPGINYLSSIFEQDDVQANEAALAEARNASNLFTPTFGNKGYGIVNTGAFGVDNTPVQFAGNNQGMINSSLQSRYGGQPQYQMGGEYDLTEEEIAEIIAAGGQIEYV